MLAPYVIVMSLVGFWMLPDDVRGVVLGFYAHLTYNERVRELTGSVYTFLVHMPDMTAILAPDKIEACSSTLMHTGCTDAFALFVSALSWTMWDAKIYWNNGVYKHISNAGISIGRSQIRFVCNRVNHDWSMVPESSDDIINTLQAKHAAWKRLM